jgi:thiol-disulfide isomerase/thioredoxin
MTSQHDFPRAPEFPSGSTWLNEDDLALRELAGHVVLLHFWDYTNIYCIDVLPYVRAWQDAYEEMGLRIVGVHTPEFDFAKSQPAVQTAVDALNITYPVLLDNDHAFWNAIGNKVWPSFYVLDPLGRVRYSDFGEWGYGAVEAVIQDLLRELNPEAALPAPVEPIRERDEVGIPLWPVTSDFQTGYEHGTIGNPEGFEPHRVVKYALHREPMEEGRYYLEGKWLNQRFCVAVAKSHEGSEACIAIPYTAAEVNMVVNPAGEVGFTVEITDNNEPLTEDSATDHIRFVGEPDGRRSQLVISDAKMYRLIKHEEVRTGVLRIYARSSGFSVYGFTFLSSPYKQGEAVDAAVGGFLENLAKAEHSVLLPPPPLSERPVAEPSPAKVAKKKSKKPAEPPPEEQPAKKVASKKAPAPKKTAAPAKAAAKPQPAGEAAAAPGAEGTQESAKAKPKPAPKKAAATKAAATKPPKEDKPAPRKEPKGSKSAAAGKAPKAAKPAASKKAAAAQAPPGDDADAAKKKAPRKRTDIVVPNAEAAEILRNKSGKKLPARGKRGEA